MKHVQKTLVATLIIGGVIGGASLALADKGDADYQQLINSQLELGDAAAIATNEIPGKVFEAELEFEDNQAIWEIEVLSTNNELYEIEIDANSGEILSQELEEDEKA